MSAYDRWLDERDPENQREREPDGEERDPDDEAVDTAQDEARYERSREQYRNNLERAFGPNFLVEIES